MMYVNYGLAVTLLMCFCVFSLARIEQCCSSCTKRGQVKYYSIDKKFNSCGECCISPSLFRVYKIFEKGLEKAFSSSPCRDLNYTSYLETVSHGFGPVKVTLDRYHPTKESDVCAAEAC